MRASVQKRLNPCFGLLVMSAPAFKARMDPFTCMLLWLCAMDDCDSLLGVIPVNLLMVSTVGNPFSHFNLLFQAKVGGWHWIFKARPLCSQSNDLPIWATRTGLHRLMFTSHCFIYTKKPKLSTFQANSSESVHGQCTNSQALPNFQKILKIPNIYWIVN